jgi:hypothetical protein
MYTGMITPPMVICEFWLHVKSKTMFLTPSCPVEKRSKVVTSTPEFIFSSPGIRFWHDVASAHERYTTMMVMEAMKL